MIAPDRKEERRYEERGCGRCDRGMLHADSFGTRQLPCPDCGGTGRVTVYLYPARRRGEGQS